MKTELKPNEVIVWKIITTEYRESCWTSSVVSKDSPYRLTYPVNEWVRPPKRTRIFAFTTQKDADFWLNNCFKPHNKISENYQLVKAIGKNPIIEQHKIRIVPISITVSVDINENRIAAMWELYLSRTQRFAEASSQINRVYTMEAPKGTTTVTHLKCLE